MIYYENMNTISRTKGIPWKLIFQLSNPGPIVLCFSIEIRFNQHKKNFDKGTTKRRRYRSQKDTNVPKRQNYKPVEPILIRLSRTSLLYPRVGCVFYSSPSPGKHESKLRGCERGPYQKTTLLKTIACSTSTK